MTAIDIHRSIEALWRTDAQRAKPSGLDVRDRRGNVVEHHVHAPGHQVDQRGDVLRGWNQSGLLPLIFAHLFSLELMRDIFGRQMQQGKGPALGANPA